MPAEPTPDRYVERSEQRWTANLPARGPRPQRAAYRLSVAVTNRLAAGTDWAYGPPPYETFEGGGLWLKDAEGWFCVRNLAGVQWNAAAVASPGKVDRLRQNARRVYERYPEAVDQLGIRRLLDTPIRDAAGVERWLDSVCNASLPVPPRFHSGVLPDGAGFLWYPAPVVEIQFVQRDGYQLWAVDPRTGDPLAVVPAPEAGPGALRLLWAPPGSILDAERREASGRGEVLVVRGDRAAGLRIIDGGAARDLGRAAVGKVRRRASAPDPRRMRRRGTGAAGRAALLRGDHPWQRYIPAHIPRVSSPEYVAAKAQMRRMVSQVDAAGGWFYGRGPWQDHHGGGLWLKDAGGWFMVRNLVGMEWSAQFAADPAKVDRLRRNARRLYAAFPEAVAELRIRDLLDTPIRTERDIAAFVDSILNASVPLPRAAHNQLQPHGTGVHYYPLPVVEVAWYARPGFRLWGRGAPPRAARGHQAQGKPGGQGIGLSA